MAPLALAHHRGPAGAACCGTRGAPARARHAAGVMGSRGRASALRVSATAQPESEPASRNSPPAGTGLLAPLRQSCDRLVQRYEHSLLSSGVGALAVTSWCVAHGQEPSTAAGVTVAATITALVLNELLFADDVPGSS
ncbi:hypothetical protein HT031_000614 [Scenedesmus sp. PABB004]|nr:hypothetical protein HT031_000614 [Scenedesmus sp. PABB004]